MQMVGAYELAYLLPTVGDFPARVMLMFTDFWYEITKVFLRRHSLFCDFNGWQKIY